MHIRKFLLTVLITIFTLFVVFFVGFQTYNSVDSTADMEEIDEGYRFAKIEGKEILIYKNQKNWKEFKIQGIELSSFRPRYSKNKSNIKKTEVLDWLKDIHALNINLIKIPTIQPPSFYKSISEFNEDLEQPIYLLHEIKLDEQALLEYHDIYHPKVTQSFEKDIKNTVDVIHGKSVIINNKRGHSGVYLNDVSQYNMGFILGGNANPEIITLNNSRYIEKNDFSGAYYSLRDGDAFDVFVAKSFDFLTSYEIKNYQQVSLLSFLSTLETDALSYSHEPNLTRDAKININKIKSNEFENLFVAYQYHPNDVDFLDFEYEEGGKEFPDNEINSFYQQLERLNKFYKKPILISDTGISSSRNRSKVDLMDGYDRGGFNEIEQGNLLVDLLSQIDKANLSGFVINSWQDNWSKRTSFNMPEDYKDISASSYWHNVLASDESFGLMAFELDLDKKVIDADFTEWKENNLFLDDDVKLKIDSDTDFLYLYLESDKNLDKENLYLGIDLTPLSGSKKWNSESIEFSMPVDFVIDLSNLDEVSMFVHDRYNLFSYRYRYYSQDIGNKYNRPASDIPNFSPIYSLNRKKFFYSDKQEIEDAIYYESGKFTRGDNNPHSNAYNSNADFNYRDNKIELRIPFAMLNVVNPYDMLAYGNLYEHGVDDKIKLKDIGFSIYDKNSKKIYEASEPYKQKDFRNIDYEGRLKESYYILQDYLR